MKRPILSALAALLVIVAYMAFHVAGRVLRARRELRRRGSPC